MQDHEAFIEAKWFVKAPKRWFGIDAKRFRDGVANDVARLAGHKARGRCSVAGMLIADDSGRFVAMIDELDLAPEVELLVLSPPS